ncbi:MAG TPA: hypothetical protein ENJ20_07095, partial [Bacteroidetes bacterium]|nr:hypothetical protein [Bacteroidota bacterium]
MRKNSRTFLEVYNDCFFDSHFFYLSLFYKKTSWIILFVLAVFINIYAEGSKQISPTANDLVLLSINNSGYNNFGQYNGSDDQRLYIHIEDPANEQIFLGFSRPVNYGNWPCNAGVCCLQNGETIGYVDGYFRIKDPNGNVVFGPQLLSAATVPISSWAEAVGGPNQIAGAGGYNAFSYSPAMAGDYYVEFSRNANSNGTDMYIEWWDITVATSGANPAAIDGRVFSRNWAFFTSPINCSGGSFGCTAANQFGLFDRPFNGIFYVYSTTDSLVTKVDFNGAGFQPVAFNIFFNDTGTGNTGDVVQDRKSLEGVLAGTALYPLFLNDPDQNVYPSGTIGTYSGDPFVVSCDGQSGQFFVTVTKPGQVDLLIDLNQASGPFLYDPGTEDIIKAIKVEPQPGEVPPYTRAIAWDGLDGLGNQVDLLTPFDFQFIYTQGAFHLPVYDAEFMTTGFTFQTVRPIPPPNANPVNIYYDDSNISDDNFNGSPKVLLDGCVAPCHTWNNGCYGDVNTINTWFFGSEERRQKNEMAICLVEAVDDMAGAAMNMVTPIDVLANDDGIAIDTAGISTTGVLQPANGMITGMDPATGQIMYLPDNGFTGTDMFEYILCDTGMFVCDTALVTVAISAPPAITNYNSDPTASASYPENGLNPVDDYDATDPDGETENGGGLTWSITGGPDQTELSIDPATGVLSFNV